MGCHSVILPGEPHEDAGAQYDVAAPPADASCDDARCAYALIGLPEPTPGVYADEGPASGTAGFRALIALPIQNQSQLAEAVTGMYTPGSPTFRKYLTPSAWSASYAPPASTVALVSSFLDANGMQVVRRSTNGLLLEFSGTVTAFNAAFHTTLHNFTRANPESGGAPLTVYGVTQDALAPVEFVHAITAIVSCDVAALSSTLQPQPGTPGTTPPSDISIAFTPAQISGVYGAADLANTGATGGGVGIGIVSGGAFGAVDVQTFWQSFGVSRADPVVVLPMEPPAGLVAEGTIDTEWSGVLAPDATVRVYEAPDAFDTSLIYTFHEAIGRAEVDIVSDSFSSREDSEALAVGAAYDAAAMQAAALGITVVASSGDGGEPDVPSASPYVTAIGGTALSFDDGGTGYTEVAWSLSGSGTTNFPIPSWQSTVAAGKFRVTADVSLNAAPSYWWYFQGGWGHAYGTSFSSPTFAGILADVEFRARGQAAHRLPKLDSLHDARGAGRVPRHHAGRHEHVPREGRLGRADRLGGRQGEAARRRITLMQISPRCR